MLPLTLRLQDGLGRLIIERTIRSDRERVSVPTTVGVLGYSLSNSEGTVAGGKVLPW